MLNLGESRSKRFVMIRLKVKEIHRYNSKSVISSDVVLSEGDTLDYYTDKVVLYNSNYSNIFTKTKYSMSDRRCSIVKITKQSGDSIWRTACFIGMKNVNKEIVALPYLAMRELGVHDGDEVIVKKGCWLPYYYFHPNHATRISTRLGILSIALSLVSIIISVI